MKHVLFFYIFLFMCINCYPSPEVTSVSSTISGTSFGAKSPAAPIIWENFDSGSEDSALSTIGWTKYFGASVTDGGSLKSENAYGGRGFSAYNSVSSETQFNTSYKTFDATNTIYVSYMSRYDITGQLNGSYKLLRIHDSSYVYGDDNAPMMTFQQSLDSDWLYSVYRYGSNINDYYQGNFNGTESGEWNRFEMYRRFSSPVGEANGVYWSALDGQTLDSETDVITLDDDITLSNSSVLLGLMFANSTATTLELRTDNVYIDNTLARVEVGNNATFANCTHREIQIPTAWSDTSISCTWNQGAHPSDTQLYLFVIDADGVASAGFPVYFSSVDGELYAWGSGPLSTWGSGPLSTKTKLSNVKTTNCKLT